MVTLITFAVLAVVASFVVGTEYHNWKRRTTFSKTMPVFDAVIKKAKRDGETDGNRTVFSDDHVMMSDGEHEVTITTEMMPTRAIDASMVCREYLLMTAYVFIDGKAVYIGSRTASNGTVSTYVKGSWEDWVCHEVRAR